MGDANADNVAWSYEQPLQPVAGIKDFIAFYRNRVEILRESDQER
ncbi:MAG: DUF427 domain-containing protein [Betaproteobacteria bacterium]|nr:DUF427 domain-containing protein [Betaproteobacteria bacterium]